MFIFVVILVPPRYLSAFLFQPIKRHLIWRYY